MKLIEELFQPLCNKIVDYCTCKTVHSHLDTKLVVTKRVCPVCNKRLKKEFMDSKFGLVVVSSSSIEIVRHKSKYITATLLSASNTVLVKSFTGEEIAKDVEPNCLNTKNLKLRYRIPYDGIKYMDSEGFNTHNKNFRPFKPGEVRGYINKDNLFVIVKNK